MIGVDLLLDHHIVGSNRCLDG